MNSNPTFVVTGRARLSYANLTRPAAREGQDPKYSVTILVPKTDVATKSRIDAAIEAAKQAGEKIWKGRPPIIAIPVHDGDGARPSDGMPFGPECRGHWVFTASCKADRRPEVVDSMKNPIIDASQIYSGMYGRGSVNFFPYNQSGKKGVGCGLNNVQKLADGEPLGSRTTADDDFDAVPEAQQFQQAPAQQYQAPTYQPPVQQPQYQQAPQGYGYTPIPQGYPPQQYGMGAGQPQATPQNQQAVDPITGQPLVYGI